MAHIHASHNDLEDKLREAARKREERRWEEHLKDRKEFNARRPFFLLLSAACILAFAYLVWRPEIPRAVQLWFAEDLVDKIYTKMYEIPADSYYNMWLGHTWSLVYLLSELLLPIVGWLVWLLMYILPLLIGSYLLMVFWHKEKLDDPLPEMTSDEEFLLDLKETMEETYDDLGILMAGVEGERKALEYLDSLADDCHIYTNLRIPYNGAESETDMVVVTPAGVTIVEVKNYKGTIWGDTSDKNLVQTKDDQDEESEKYNPIRQVGTHAYRMAGYLRTHGVQTYVRTCVFFVCEDVILELTDREKILVSKCPVFKVQDVGRLRYYLQSNDSVFSRNEYWQTLKLLDFLVR